MSIGLVRGNTIIGVEEEVTEGTYVAPSGATKYLQPLEGFSLKPAREVIDRALTTASPGKETPRLGVRSVAGQIPVEFRGSGVAGGETDFDSLLKAALGARRQNTASVTTKSSGNTSTVLAIQDADIAKFNVGDIVLVKEAGAYEVRPIVSKTTGTGTATITLAFALTNGAPSNSVVVEKFTTYLTAATGHPSLSLSYYWGNEIRQAGVGCRVTQMSLENFQAGKVPSLNFQLEGVGYSEDDGAAPHTPTYDAGVPPVLLGACVFRNGVVIDVNALGLTLANELGFITKLCSENGRAGSRVQSREVTGTINPYKDDTSTAFFDDWDAGTEFSLFAYAYVPSATPGEFAAGNTVAIWLPQCFTTEFETQDQEQILIDQMSFRATRGNDGSKEELYLGFI